MCPLSRTSTLSLEWNNLGYKVVGHNSLCENVLRDLLIVCEGYKGLRDIGAVFRGMCWNVPCQDR